MRTTKTVRVPFEVGGMDFIGADGLLLCGEGRITQVNLESGVFSRILTASNTANYSCVKVLDEEHFYFATEDGRLGIMSLASGEELGSVQVGFPVIGIVPLPQKIMAYGGDWKKDSRSAAFVTRELEKVPPAY